MSLLIYKFIFTKIVEKNIVTPKHWPVLLLHRFKTNEGVIIIGATNFPEALDKYVYLIVQWTFDVSFSSLEAFLYSVQYLVISFPQSDRVFVFYSWVCLFALAPWSALDASTCRWLFLNLTWEDAQRFSTGTWRRLKWIQVWHQHFFSPSPMVLTVLSSHITNRVLIW